MAATTSLWAAVDGRMAQVLTVPAGTALQVTETQNGGWRQVVIREPGKPARWGWVPENQIQVGEASTPAAPAAQAQAQAQRPAVAERAAAPWYGRSREDTRFTLGLKGGGGYLTAGAFLPSYGLEAGVRIRGDLDGALYFNLQVTSFFVNTSFNFAGTPFDATGIFIFPAIGLTGRNLFGSGFFFGGYLGGSLLMANITEAGVPTYSGLLPGVYAALDLGYQIRLVKHFSFGPELLLDYQPFLSLLFIQGMVGLRVHL